MPGSPFNPRGPSGPAGPVGPCGPAGHVCEHSEVLLLINDGEYSEITPLEF